MLGFAVKSYFDTFSGSGRVRSGRVDGNSDNRANSAEFQLKLPTQSELGNMDHGK